MGLFPDNFVEVIGAKNESQEQESQWHETSSAKSSIRHSHQITKKVEKAHVRKSLDTRNILSSNISGEIRRDTTISYREAIRLFRVSLT